MRNDGLEERFYIPLEHYDEWNRVVWENNLSRFRMGSTGVPLGTEKTSAHLFIEDKLKKNGQS